MESVLSKERWKGGEATEPLEGGGSAVSSEQRVRGRAREEPRTRKSNKIENKIPPSSRRKTRSFKPGPKSCSLFCACSRKRDRLRTLTKQKSSHEVHLKLSAGVLAFSQILTRPNKNVFGRFAGPRQRGGRGPPRGHHQGHLPVSAAERRGGEGRVEVRRQVSGRI